MFVWLNSVELAKQRVAIRVSKGGHNIPDEVIERRYKRGIRNLKDFFLNLCDEYIITDNSGNTLQLIAKSVKKDIQIFDQNKYQLILK